MPLSVGLKFISDELFRSAKEKLLWQTLFSVFGFGAFCVGSVISRLMARDLLIFKFVMVFLFRTYRPLLECVFLVGKGQCFGAVYH